MNCCMNRRMVNQIFVQQLRGLSDAVGLPKRECKTISSQLSYLRNRNTGNSYLLYCPLSESIKEMVLRRRYLLTNLSVQNGFDIGLITVNTVIPAKYYLNKCANQYGTEQVCQRNGTEQVCQRNGTRQASQAITLINIVKTKELG